MESSSPSAVVSSFRAAADWFVELTALVPHTAWLSEGLGDWTVRDLVGHTGRAMSTVAEYVTDRVGAPDVERPIDYYRGLALSGPESADLNAAVAERGRQAGGQLGDDPPGFIASLRDSVVALVDATDPDTLTTSRGGTMRLRDYLPTRTFELTVHGLDLESALRRIGVNDLPPAPASALADTLHLLADLVVLRGRSRASELILVLTGRGSLREGYSAL